MKKLLLATAIAALSVSAAQAAPTLYGKAFVTTDYVNAELDRETMDGDTSISTDSDSVQINSNLSRLGFKGSEAMTANTDVIYQLEYGINIDDSGEDNIAFKSRDTYLGLVNKDFGQFRFGRNYSVSDYINNVTVTEGYWYNIGSSSLDEGTLSEALTLTDGSRINNSIIWFAPKYNDLPLELALQYSADEAFVSDSNDRDNGYGASLMYNPGNGFTAGIALDDDMSIDGEILRGSATIDLSKYSAYPVKLGALYQQADYDGADEEDGLIISAKMGLANFARPATVYLQYNKTENLSGLNGNDSDQVVLGGTYSFKDNMIAHAYIGQNSADLDNGLFIVRDAETDQAGEVIDARGDADVFAIGAGLEYLF
ncbi:porin [Psychrobacter sp. PP-21]|uniref:porin n=1 Tax=Psychrobacter sp. PP-21 TaxID=2957503 RepID=UPI0029B7D0C2|nr:porin [Psychrobacter sp. PP-21]MDX2373914.1 porin [Psychrobacter sp. PP-21]